MANVIADVIRLFLPEASFLGNSKQGQAAVAPDTLRWLVHNISSDSIIVGISDDSLQMLLAGDQDVTGVKTFVNGLNVTSDSDGLFIRSQGNEVIILNNSFGGSFDNLVLDTSSGDVIIRVDGQQKTLFQTNVITNAVQVAFAPSTSSRSSINIPAGSIPSTPVNGDMWGTGDSMNTQINGTTVQRFVGTGSPEGVVTANVGAIYTDDAGPAGATLYMKEGAGVTNTPWVPITSVETSGFVTINTTQTITGEKTFTANLGVGATGPIGTIHISSNNTNDQIRIEKTGTGAGAGWIWINNNVLSFSGNNAQTNPTLSINMVSGFVGINNVAAASPFHVVSNQSNNAVARIFQTQPTSGQSRGLEVRGGAGPTDFSAKFSSAVGVDFMTIAGNGDIIIPVGGIIMGATGQGEIRLNGPDVVIEAIAATGGDIYLTTDAASIFITAEDTTFNGNVHMLGGGGGDTFFIGPTNNVSYRYLTSAGTFPEGLLIDASQVGDAISLHAEQDIELNSDTGQVIMEATSVSFQLADVEHAFINSLGITTDGNLNMPTNTGILRMGASFRGEIGYDGTDLVINAVSGNIRITTDAESIFVTAEDTHFDGNVHMEGGGGGDTFYIGPADNGSLNYTNPILKLKTTLAGESLVLGSGNDIDTMVLDANNKVTLLAPSTVRATFNIPHGTAPTTPVNGDIWTTTAGLFLRVNGATVGPLT